MKSLSLVALALTGASAFPAILQDLTERASAGQSGCSTSALCNKKITITNEQIGYNPKAPTAAQKISAARQNCGGVTPCHVFDAAEQQPSITGSNAYASPLSTQIRGPCPGLNAAANHGYLPRSGVPNIQQTQEGLNALYGMANKLGVVLAVLSIALVGDPLTQTWSIGGPQGALLSNPQGIAWSHSKYEGDSSIGRCDAYTNGGDAHSLSTTRFAYAYEAGMAEDRYTMDNFAQAFAMNTFRSVQSNPYYFAPLFATTLVSPAAYNFVIAFMSNHSAQDIGGYLDGETFKSFFAISGDYPNFKWNEGQEKVPKNWYRRPLATPYTTAAIVADDAFEFAAYPSSFRFGGNTGGVNTYTGIDLEDFTGGVYNAKNLLDPKNLACFVYQNIQQGLPDVASTSPISSAGAKLLDGVLGNFITGITCPEVAKFNNNNLPPYTGRGYSPSAPANNRMNC